MRAAAGATSSARIGTTAVTEVAFWRDFPRSQLAPRAAVRILLPFAEMYDLVTHTISQGLQAFLPIAFCLPWFRRTGDRDAVAAVQWGLLAAAPLTAAGAYWIGTSTRQALWEAALAGVAFVLATWFARSMTRGSAVVPSARGATLVRLAVAIGAGTLVARQTMEIAIVSAAALELRAVDPLLALASGVALSVAASAAWVIAARRLSTAVLRRATIVFALLFVVEAAFYAFHESAEARLLPWSEALHAATEPFGPDGVYGRYASVLLLIIPALAIMKGRGAQDAAIGRMRRARTIVRPAAAAVIVLMIASLGLMGIASGDRSTPATELPTTSAAAIAAGPHVLFRSMTIDSTYNRLSVAPLDPRDGADRAVSALTCERVSYSAGRGICLDYHHAVFPTYKTVLFDRALTPTRSMPLAGRPSRTRTSPDGRLGAITAFVTGHSYIAASLATKTTILDMESGDELGDLEQFSTWRNGARFKAADFNFWGVTFAAESNVFYATLRTAATGQLTTFLVRGDLALRKLTVLRENVECPSLSPDNRLIAFKKRVGPDSAPWRIYLLDVATLTDRPLAVEKRSVDDQIEWLDNGHVLYAVPRANEPVSSDIWLAPIDNSAAPRIFLAHAESPIVVR